MSKWNILKLAQQHSLNENYFKRFKNIVQTTTAEHASKSASKLSMQPNVRQIFYNNTVRLDMWHPCGAFCGSRCRRCTWVAIVLSHSAYNACCLQTRWLQGASVCSSASRWDPVLRGSRKLLSVCSRAASHEAVKASVCSDYWVLLQSGLRRAPLCGSLARRLPLLQEARPPSPDGSKGDRQSASAAGLLAAAHLQEVHSREARGPAPAALLEASVPPYFGLGDRPPVLGQR